MPRSVTKLFPSGEGTVVAIHGCLFVISFKNRQVDLLARSTKEVFCVYTGHPWPLARPLVVALALRKKHTLLLGVT